MNEQYLPSNPARNQTGHISRRTVGKGIAWSVPVIAIGARAPAMSASPPPAGYHEVTLLGWNNALDVSNSEFRADFTIVVQTGELPAQIQYRYNPTGSTDMLTLTRVPDVQASVDQAYGIVATEELGNGLQKLYISARGDLDVSSPSTPSTYQETIQITWQDGTITRTSFPMLVTSRNNEGRPVSVNAWDTTTSGLPGYVGPNSQTGWGNVVPAGSTDTLQGAKFHVDAVNSGRDAATGNDVTDELYYQFVRGDNGAAASVTPTPVRISITNHGSGVEGALLTELGSFSLDSPGYYKLLVWPQSRNSSGAATPTSDGVAWRPGVDPGQQVGSVFWKIS